LDQLEDTRYDFDKRPPMEGWKDVYIRDAQGRRFASCMVMARCASRGHFVSLQDKMSKPTKGCQECFKQAKPLFLEPFCPANPEHVLLGPHKCHLCLECFRFGDWCSRTATQHDCRGCRTAAADSHRGQKTILPWMMGHCFRATEAGLEADIEFEGVGLRLLCVPDIFAIEEAVFQLGQTALVRHNNKRLFDSAFDLFNDRCSQGDPSSFKDALLLLNHRSIPRRTNLLCQDWQTSTGLDVAASASLVSTMEAQLSVDVEACSLHIEQKNGIAEVLMDSYGMDQRPVRGAPDGWLRFPLKHKDRRWEGVKCYHGTSMSVLAPILASGLKRPSGRHSKAIAHGQAGSKTGRTIYLSPSWHYSAHPVYSPLHKGFGWPVQPEAFQMVLECSVREQYYRTQRGTLASKHWDRKLRIDPERPTLENLEFLVEDEASVRITGVMFRKFGKHVDRDTFGDLPTRLNIPTTIRGWSSGTGSAVEYLWTELLQTTYREEGLLLDAPEPQ